MDDINLKPRAARHQYKMSSYSSYFDTYWRGWYDGHGVYEADKNFIIGSTAACYNDLLNEAIVLKKRELDALGGEPFYEPSTYYRSFREGHKHANPEWAATRYASDQFSRFSRYRAHRCHDLRVVPEERDEYELKLWRISHPDPLTAPVRDLGMTINEMTATEPWAWPMMIGVDSLTSQLPVVTAIQENFMALGHTKNDFTEGHTALYKMLQWDSAKGM